MIRSWTRLVPHIPIRFVEMFYYRVVVPVDFSYTIFQCKWSLNCSRQRGTRRKFYGIQTISTNSTCRNVPIRQHSSNLSSSSNSTGARYNTSSKINFPISSSSADNTNTNTVGNTFQNLVSSDNL
jgi:hypothetical protein